MNAPSKSHSIQYLRSANKGIEKHEQNVNTAASEIMPQMIVISKRPDVTTAKSLDTSLRSALRKKAPVGRIGECITCSMTNPVKTLQAKMTAQKCQ